MLEFGWESAVRTSDGVSVIGTVVTVNKSMADDRFGACYLYCVASVRCMYDANLSVHSVLLCNSILCPHLNPVAIRGLDEVR